MNLMPLNIQLFGASLYVSAYETDIDTANNTSYVYLTISATTTGQTWNATGSAYVNATLTGQNNVCTIPTTYFNINRNSTVTVYSGKVGPFYHNTDGSLNPIQINASSYITSNYSPTGWTTCNMSTIARKSSVYASNAEIEGTSVITINKQASSFTHTLTYQFGSLSGTIVSYTSASSVNFNIPNSFYAQIPNSKTGTCTITCTTYSNGTNIGSTSTSFTVSCNESKCKPSVSATVIDAKQATVALTGDSSKLVRYKSTARITPSATSKNSASITSKSVENQVVSSYLDISNVSKNSFNVSATDSRGFVTSITKTATMIEYVQLTCSAIFKRENQTSSVVNLNYSGNYYGTSKKFVEEKLKEGKSVLLEIELQGALQVIKKCPDAVTIFIKPPSFEELEKRLRGRHSESEEAIQKRLIAAKEELNNANKFHYVIENKIVDEAVDELIEIYNKETK